MDRRKVQPENIVKKPAESEYLKEIIGVPLQEALADVIVMNPSDPIDYIANYLRKWRENDTYRKNKKEEEAIVKELRAEREARLAELRRLREEQRRLAREEEEERKRKEEEEEARRAEEEAAELARQQESLSGNALPTLPENEEDEEAKTASDEEPDETKDE